MLTLALTLLLAHPEWRPPVTAMTHREAEQQARDWFYPTGTVPFAWQATERDGLCGSRPGRWCCVGPYHEACGSGRTWEAAFQDARRRGYDPSR